jgi:hypothetical protein
MLLETFQRLARFVASSEGDRCVIHGDAHVGNLYLDGAGRPCLVDWQLVQHAPWYLDVGYHIGCTLDPVLRRANERSLLEHYLDCLRHERVELPDPAEIATGIDLGLIYGFFLWAITIKVDPAITTVMLERFGTAVADHDAYRHLQ